MKWVQSKEVDSLKIKKGSVAIYVLAMMLVTAGYWNYISNESQKIETVSISQNNQENQDSRNEHIGDATLVNNSELILMYFLPHLYGFFHNHGKHIHLHRLNHDGYHNLRGQQRQRQKCSQGKCPQRSQRP